MDEHATREKHVKDLIHDRFGGKKSKFSKATGIDPTIVSRWFMRGRHHKNIGEQSARQIEGALDLDPNSLDRIEEPPSRKTDADGWPFSRALHKQYIDLTDTQKLKLEGRVEEIIYEFMKLNAAIEPQRKSKPRRTG